MNTSEIESYIDEVRKAQHAGPYIDQARLEHVKVLALLAIAQKLSVIEELGIRSTVITDGNFVVKEAK
jgi:hypothetical protein